MRTMWLHNTTGGLASLVPVPPQRNCSNHPRIVQPRQGSMAANHAVGSTGSVGRAGVPWRLFPLGGTWTDSF